LIDISQLNQAICKETQSLIINNHSQINEGFTSISTLVLSLKETFVNHISNLFKEQMKQIKTGNDNSLQEQLLNETKNLLQNFKSKFEAIMNQTIKELLHKTYNETKTDLHQILLKINDNTLKNMIKKKLQKIESRLESAAENSKNVNDLLEL
jgi:hypothetical protein